MLVTPLSKEDLSDSERFFKTVFLKDYNAAGISDIAESLKNDRLFWRCWVLKQSNKFVGLTGLYEYIRGIDIVWLGWFGIMPDERRKGYGEYLLAWTIEEAQRMEKKRLRLYTSTDHPEAQFLYEKLGFKVFRTDRKYIYRELKL